MKKEKGFALLELFIALTISLVLLAGVLQVFLNNQTNANLTAAFNQLQENSRFIDLYLMRVIRLAGYRSPPPIENNFTAVTNIFTGSTAYVSGTNATGFNGSDTLTIRFQGSGDGLGTPDGTITDCLNVPADSNTLVTNTFSLTSNYELQCQSLNANSSTPNNTQVLMSGVENMEVLYGEDTNGDYTPDRYVPANYAYINWNNVVAVRLCLLLRSSDPSATIAKTKTYNLLGRSYATATDKYIRTQLVFTVVLRNLIVNPA